MDDGFRLVRRPRRLRRSAAVRDMVRETTLTSRDLVMPVFVTHEAGVVREIPSMPGICQLGIDELDREIDAILGGGVRQVMLFGLPGYKDAVGSDTWRDDGLIQRAVRHLRASYPELVVITDVCFCEYTDHGHCGVLTEGGVLDNDATLANLQLQAVAHAQAGAQVVAPSGMIDGMVGAMRSALDDNGFHDVAILSYAVKYASAFYGPFRDAVDSAPAFGDRRTHQMDPANAREALVEAALDVAEGADMLMVKPALAYLDVVRAVRERFDLPVAAYNVSGEYAMVKAAAALGWIDERAVRYETLLSMKRAGADLIITYFARDVGPELA